MEDSGACEQRQALHHQRAGRIGDDDLPAQRFGQAAERNVPHHERLAQVRCRTVARQEQREACRRKAIPVFMLFPSRPKHGSSLVHPHRPRSKPGVEPELQREDDARLRMMMRAHAAARKIHAAAESELARMTAHL